MTTIACLNKKTLLDTSFRRRAPIKKSHGLEIVHYTTSVSVSKPVRKFSYLIPRVRTRYRISFHKRRFLRLQTQQMIALF